jgi:hypothetical protein
MVGLIIPEGSTTMFEPTNPVTPEPQDTTEVTEAPAPRLLVKVANFDGGEPVEVPFVDGQTAGDYLQAGEVQVPHDSAVSLNGVDVSLDRVLTREDVANPDAEAGTMLAILTVARNAANG